MHLLQTKVDIPNSKFLLNHNDKILFIGSCFAENVGVKLKECKFSSLVNPFGVNYNPVSVANSLERILGKNLLSEDDLEVNNDLYFSFSHDTTFSNIKKKECVENINNSIIKAHEFVKSITCLNITLGTAWIYRLESTNKVVANCHKLPASYFKREMLGITEIVKKLKSVINAYLKINPELKIIFTVSPVRHWKDGAIENQRSKSVLLLAVKELENILPELYYFPSFEIMMDELRDYRFYDDDMLHPSGLAIEIIWQYFQKTFFNTNTLELIKKVEKYQQAISHRPRNENSREYEKFKIYLEELSRQLRKLIPGADF